MSPEPNDPPNERQKLRTAVDWTFVFTAIAAVAAGAAAVAASWQAWIARDIEHKQLRAYVTMSGMALETYDPQSEKKGQWTNRAIWKNSGLTPTRNLKMTTHSTVSYPVGEMNESHDQAALVIGPGDETMPLAMGATGYSHGEFTISGIAIYEDIFGDPHVSVGCRTVRIGPTLKEKKPGEMSKVDSSPCGTGSDCTDKECAGYRADIAKDVKKYLEVDIPPASFK